MQPLHNATHRYMQPIKSRFNADKGKCRFTYITFAEYGITGTTFRSNRLFDPSAALISFATSAAEAYLKNAMRHQY